MLSLACDTQRTDHVSVTILNEIMIVVIVFYGDVARFKGVLNTSMWTDNAICAFIALLSQHIKTGISPCEKVCTGKAQMDDPAHRHSLTKAFAVSKRNKWNLKKPHTKCRATGPHWMAYLKYMYN